MEYIKNMCIQKKVQWFLLISLKPTFHSEFFIQQVLVGHTLFTRHFVTLKALRNMSHRQDSRIKINLVDSSFLECVVFILTKCCLSLKLRFTIYHF